MEWEIRDTVKDALGLNDVYEAEDYIENHYCDDSSRRQQALSLLRRTYAARNTATAAVKAAKKEPPKVSIRPDRELEDADWEILKEIEPALVLQMFRLRFKWTNMTSPNTWLKDNCKGFYRLPGSNKVMFELEEDAVLFKMTFEGSA